MCSNTCDYIARKQNPETWNNKSSSTFFLDNDPDRGGLGITEWRCPHQPLERDGDVDEKYCIFHTNSENLPEDIDETEELLKALDKAGNKPHADRPEHFGQFIGATFENLDLTDKTITATEDHDIRFDHAVFRGRDENISFENATIITMGEPVSFWNTSFIAESNNDILFCGSKFVTEETGGILFRSTVFRSKGSGSISFQKSKFVVGATGTVSFTGSGFTTEGSGGVSFKDVKFIAEGTGGDAGSLSFRYARFTAKGNGDVSFKNTSFISNNDSNLSFKNAKFTTEGEGHVSFGGAKFIAEDEGDILFGRTKFRTKGEGNVLFPESIFKSKGEGKVWFGASRFSTKQDQRVWFRGAKFIIEGSGGVAFEGATFSNEGAGKLWFWDMRIVTEAKGDLSFKDATFTTDGDLNFCRTAICGKVSFEEAKFNAPTRFSDLWIDAATKLSFSNADFYEQCVVGATEGVPYIRGELNFSNATFHKSPDFKGGRETIEQTADAPTSSIPAEETVTTQSPLFEAAFVDSVNFAGARFTNGANFSRIKFSRNTTFDRAELSGGNFVGADLSGASLERARLNRAELLGTILIGANLYGALLGDARINHETRFWPTTDLNARKMVEINDLSFGRVLRRVKTRLRRGRLPYCSYDPRYVAQNLDVPHEEVDLEKAAEVYGTLESVANDNSLPTLASDCFLGRKDVQFRQYWRQDDLAGRQWGMTIRSFVPNFVARYGESPWRVLGTGAFLVLTFGLLYWAFDLIERTGTADSSVALWDGVYFSALTFTTLGYGDFNPVNQVGQALAVLETAMGVILLAILVFVFGRRATR